MLFRLIIAVCLLSNPNNRLRDNCACDALPIGRSLPFGLGDEDSLRRLRQISFAVKTSLQALGLVDADWRYLQPTISRHTPNYVRQERAKNDYVVVPLKNIERGQTRI